MSDCDSHSEDEVDATQVGVADDDDDETAMDIFERVRLYKARGNECYQTKKYRKSIAWYGRVIDLVLLEPVCGEGGVTHAQDREDMEKEILAAAHCNRAAAYLSCGEWNKTISDCDEVLRLGQSNALTVKALYRRGKAYESLGDADNARRDFENALLLEPNNKLAFEAFENHKSVLHRLVVLSRGTPEVRNRQRKGL